MNKTASMVLKIIGASLAFSGYLPADRRLA